MNGSGSGSVVSQPRTQALTSATWVRGWLYRCIVVSLYLVLVVALLLFCRYIVITETHGQQNKSTQIEESNSVLVVT
jgi:hypothetical protein